MDALSDILRVVGLTGGLYLEAEMTEPWAVVGQVAPELCRPFMVEPQRVVGFHYVLEGGFDLDVGDLASARVSEGQVVMLPRNEMHVLRSGAKTTPLPAAEVVRPPEAFGVAGATFGGGGARTRMVCGFMGGNEQLYPLLSSLPSAIVVDVANLPGGDWIAGTLTYAARTLANGDPGTATVVAKVSELLFVETLRRHLAAMPEDAVGWLAALRDPVIGRSLSLLHARVDQAWTTEALAGAVNMSRSAFAERFTAVVGEPPMTYLAGWRMQLACQMLRDSIRSVSEIAFEVGYGSEAAFTRAFRRERGVPPASWRRQARQSN
ncbi:AraC family transcriptional regulator [Phenylobacterium sp. LjRoot225]|uniref:AraC family transcriptional regulator n=1 Tax=Phenylobacterium sp. LjRoot225 TaxID=3342285 RepID=UPI003ECDE7A8